MEEWNYKYFVCLFDALSHPMRIKIIEVLKQNRQYVSELARILKISRALLSIHLKKLEEAGLVKSYFELSNTGKAMKYYELQPFSVLVTPELLENIAKTISLDMLQNNRKS